MKTIQEESDDLVRDVKSRARWLSLLKVPEFKARVTNPRKALSGDLIKVTYNSATRGRFSRVSILLRDAEDTQSRGRECTEYTFTRVYQEMKYRCCYRCEDAEDSGTGFLYYLKEPGQFGVQAVDVVGTTRISDLNKAGVVSFRR